MCSLGEAFGILDTKTKCDVVDDFSGNIGQYEDVSGLGYKTGIVNTIQDSHGGQGIKGSYSSSATTNTEMSALQQPDQQKIDDKLIREVFMTNIDPYTVRFGYKQLFKGPHVLKYCYDSDRFIFYLIYSMGDGLIRFAQWTDFKSLKIEDFVLSQPFSEDILEKMIDFPNERAKVLLMKKLKLII